MRKIATLIAGSFFLTAFEGRAQTPQDCPDPFAQNYFVLRKNSCHNCTYKAATLSTDNLGRMPEDVKETSGLLWFGGHPWTINDSGDGPYLYQLSETGEKVLRKVWVDGAKNKDWEELTQDSNRIFIGDFGNNEGSRDKLIVYVIQKKDLKSDTVKAERIRFSYPDQKDFSHRNRAHNFDCEAMVCIGDSLHLFTKNWTNHYTKHYIIPALPGKFTARLMDSVNVQMLVTGACWLAGEKMLALIGYNIPGSAYIWIFTQATPAKMLAGPRRKIEIGNLTETGQVEAICTGNYDTEFLISNEDFKGLIPPSLQRFEAGPLINEFPPGGLSGYDVEDMNLFPNQLEGYVNLELIMKHEDSVHVQLYAARAKAAGPPMSFAVKRGYNQLKLPIGDSTPPGVYVVLVCNREKQISGTKFSW